MLTAVILTLAVFILFSGIIGWACCALGGIADRRIEEMRVAPRDPQDL